jgi:hypothetical protein
MRKSLPIFFIIAALATGCTKPEDATGPNPAASKAKAESPSKTAPITDAEAKSTDSEKPKGEESAKSDVDVVGVWNFDMSTMAANDPHRAAAEKMTLEFKGDKTYAGGGSTGTYAVKGHTLTLTDSKDGKSDDLTISEDGKKLSATHDNVTLGFIKKS